LTSVFSGHKAGLADVALQFVVSGNSRPVEVVDLGNFGEGYKLDDDVNSGVLGGKEQDAGDFAKETADELHKADAEGDTWKLELIGVVGAEFHHALALLDVSLGLEMHE
jgi:hypothetical protein